MHTRDAPVCSGGGGGGGSILRAHTHCVWVGVGWGCTANLSCARTLGEGPLSWGCIHMTVRNVTGRGGGGSALHFGESAQLGWGGRVHGHSDRTVTGETSERDRVRQGVRHVPVSACLVRVIASGSTSESLPADRDPQLKGPKQNDASMLDVRHVLAGWELVRVIASGGRWSMRLACQRQEPPPPQAVVAYRAQPG